MRALSIALVLSLSVAGPALGGDRASAPAALQDFVGQYDLSDGRVLTVTARRGQLVVQLGDAVPARAQQTGPARFTAPGVEIAFDRRTNGNVAGVTLLAAL